MFEYFYNEILRRTVIAFGSLFNNINIKHLNTSDQVVSVIKVPLAYGPTQKFLARINQSPDLNKSVAMTLPRMSFEFTGLTYDSSRKVTTTQTFTAKDPTDGTETKKAYMPVPYNMSIELVESIKEKRDIPIVLENITMQDDYEGDFSTRRVILYTLRFTAKTYLFGPVSSATKDIIKKVSVGYLTDGTTREVVYSSEPRAIKNYTGIVVANLTSDITTTDTLIAVNDASSISVNTYLDLEGEEVYVKLKSGNILTVERGRDNTTITSHLSGSEVKSITATDDTLIESGDDFGFSGSTIWQIMKMTKKFNNLNDTFNVDTEIVSTNEVTPIEKIDKIAAGVDDVKKDYEYTRGNLYSLIEKGQEAINGILELAQESEMPRAYEVAGQLIKNVADATDKLMDLQKKLRDIEEEKQSKGPTNVTNALFVGSTADLAKLLKQQTKDESV